MKLETKKYLFDIQQACRRLIRFTSAKTLAEYETDELLRAGVERQFQIAGEALSQLAKGDPGTATRISEYQRIIAFRNILVHGYDAIDPVRVWDLVQSKLLRLVSEVDALLQEPED